MSWTAAVDYSAGRRHRRDKIPCQDYGQIIRLNEDLILGAIADGAGTCPLSHLGAQAAVGTVLNTLAARFHDTNTPNSGSRSLSAILDDSVEIATDAIARAASNQGFEPKDLATTFLVFVAGPIGFALLQVGDGALVYRAGNGDYEVAVEPDRGEFANETLFVNDAIASSEARRESRAGKVSFIAAFTDGLAPVSIANRDCRPHAPFFKPLEAFVSDSESDGEVHRGIRSFLRSDRLTERTDDDMTLMLCGWQPDGRPQLSHSAFGLV